MAANSTQSDIGNRRTLVLVGIAAFLVGYALSPVAAESETCATEEPARLVPSSVSSETTGDDAARLVEEARWGPSAYMFAFKFGTWDADPAVNLDLVWTGP